MSEYPNRPRVRFAEVREFVSANGRPYFVAFLGKTKLIMLRNDRAEPPGNATAVWDAFLEETDPAAKPKPQQPAASSRGPGPGPRSAVDQRNRSAQASRAEASLRERGIDPASAPPEDDLGF